MKFFLAELVEAEVVQYLRVLFVVHDREIELAIFVVNVQQLGLLVPEVVLKDAHDISALVSSAIIVLFHAKFEDIGDFVSENVFIFQRWT